MPTKKVVKAKTKKVPAKKPVAKKSIKKTARKVVKKVPAKKAVKKSVFKKTTKKITAKKVASKSSLLKGKKSLIYAADTASFWVTNGQILNSLLALRDALDEMEKEVYSYHAEGAHNDFANWVDTVLADGVCAKDLEQAKTPRSAKTVVVRHLKAYSVK